MKMKDVEFVKGTQWDMFEGNRTFWRADYQGRTIVSMCKTKKECMDEVRYYIKRKTHSN